MSDEPRFNQISSEGLWRNNPALVQLLGLCPLLAVSGSVVNALGLGLATVGVLCGSNLTVSLLRHHVMPAIRLPAFVLIIAAFVTCAELLMQAFAHGLYLALGIFIPLIVTNCTILGRAETFASRHPPGTALLDGFMMGLGFAAVLVLLGALREIAGTGHLLADMELLLPFAAEWTVTVIPGHPGFLLAVLPPGAFIFLGLLIALKNLIDQHARKHASSRGSSSPGEITAGGKRVRITG